MPLHPHGAGFIEHQDLIDLLIARGTPVDRRESAHGGTPIDWALHGWMNSGEDEPDPRFYGVVASLARAGSKPHPSSLDESEPRSRLARRIKADPRMQAALEGRVLG